MISYMQVAGVYRWMILTKIRANLPHINTGNCSRFECIYGPLISKTSFE